MSKFWSTLLAGALGGLVTFGAIKLTEQPRVENAAPATAAKQVNYDYGGAPVTFDFTKAAERAMPAVVHIKAMESRESAIQRQRQTNPFRYFLATIF
ncbi:MAG: hypothetical protein IPJ00_21670 [Saprospirales bacterium]|nr:hypothetical protein [Saprospirales bacterium]